MNAGNIGWYEIVIARYAQDCGNCLVLHLLR